MQKLKNCECCFASYGRGQSYGEEWCEFPIYENGVMVEPKGLCEFCNPNNLKWFIKDKKCHKK